MCLYHRNGNAIRVMLLDFFRDVWENATNVEVAK